MTRSVLLLDDEPAVLGVLSDYLSTPGLEIVTCREIEAAEAILGARRFDVVVTDLRVSELGGLEGMRLIRYVSTHFPETTVLAMSGYVNDDVHALGRAVGAEAILEKPIDLRRLRRYIHGEDGPKLSEAGDEEGQVWEIQPLDEFLAERSIIALMQPIVQLDPSGPPFLAHGYESLARAPVGTPLRNPEILFAYASKKERLFETDMLCIEAALKEGKNLPIETKLFINTQPRSMTNPDFASRAIELIDREGIQTERIVFELTEQQTIVNPVAFGSTLKKMRDRGFAIALDDYGVGFANIQLIQDLRPDYLKISGYFCKGIQDNPFQQIILESTAEMATKLGIPTILENVETADELAMIQNMGLTYGQGYFFARPAPVDELLETGRFTHLL